MSANWSTAAQTGSAYGGFEDPAQRPPSAGTAPPAFEVENVGFDAAVSPAEASRRKNVRNARLAAEVETQTNRLDPDGHNHHNQQQEDQKPDQKHHATKLATQSKILAGSGAQFGNGNANANTNANART